MKILYTFLFFLSASCARGKEIIFVASTPADALIRSFLGISPSDSIDFIRWELIIHESFYRLQCNYGISKPNTNGFIDGGEKVELTGKYRKQNHHYFFQNKTQTLKAIELNKNLLHILDPNNQLLIGNSGWSYTFNNTNPTADSKLNINSPPFTFEDSIILTGRTPCKIPGIVEPGKSCYKLKWKIILYREQATGKSGHFKINGTAWRVEQAIEGEWKILSGEYGRVSYVLTYSNKKSPLFLLKLSDNILVFTNAEGSLLVGDDDFSYTLNHGLK